VHGSEPETSILDLEQNLQKYGPNIGFAPLQHHWKLHKAHDCKYAENMKINHEPWIPTTEMIRNDAATLLL
jgi:hypothetical protein